MVCFFSREVSSGGVWGLLSSCVELELVFDARELGLGVEAMAGDCDEQSRALRSVT